MRTRRSIVLLVLALLVAGCGGGDEGGGDESSQELVFWVAEDVAERVARLQATVDRFTQETNQKVKLVAVAEDQLATQIQSASAGGTLPDVFGSLPLGFVHSLAADDLADPDAANEVVESLGRDTFSPRALELVTVEGKPIGVPSDGFPMLLYYRKDLFEQAGLEAPDSFDKILAAATKLNQSGRAGIVASTKPKDTFTQQTFEYFAVANGCQLTDDSGAVTLTSPNCVNTFKFFGDLINQGSTKGGQDVDTTRAAYFAGKSAMIVWSSFLLDELAGLRNDARPTCPECRADKRFLAENTGIVTAISGTDSSTPSAWGEEVSYVITKDGNTDAAKRFIEFMLSDGYAEWLGLSAEGRFPVRLGTADNPEEYAQAWAKLQTGVDSKAQLSELYPPEVLEALSNSIDNMNRWGFAQNQGRLAGALLNELPVTTAQAGVFDGGLTPDAAAQQAQGAVEELKQSLE